MSRKGPTSVIRVGEVSKVNYEAGTIEVTYKDRDDSVTSEICMFSNALYRMPVVGTLVAVLHNSDSAEMGTCIGTFWNAENVPVDGAQGLYRYDYNDEQGVAFETYDGNTGDYESLIDGNTKETVQKSAEVNVSENVTSSVGGDVDATVGGSVSSTVSGDAAHEVSGDVTHNVGGDVTFTVSGDMVFNVGGSTVKVCQDGTIEITGNTIKIEGTTINMSGSTVNIEGSSGDCKINNISLVNHKQTFDGAAVAGPYTVSGMTGKPQ